MFFHTKIQVAFPQYLGLFSVGDHGDNQPTGPPDGVGILGGVQLLWLNQPNPLRTAPLLPKKLWPYYSGTPIGTKPLLALKGTRRVFLGYCERREDGWPKGSLWNGSWRQTLRPVAVAAASVAIFVGRWLFVIFNLMNGGHGGWCWKRLVL